MDAIPLNPRDSTSDSMLSQNSGSSTDVSITATPIAMRNSGPMPTCEDENKEPVGPHVTSWVDRFPSSSSGPSRNRQARESPRRRDRWSTRQEAEEEDQGDDEDVDKTPRAIADETLRSAPGVRGVGEGWAGGPRPGSKTGWWRRKKSTETEDDDPLSLWARHVEADEIRKNSLSASPVKALWNRSVQAFGSSMPHLSLTGDRKKWGMGKRGSIEDKPTRLQDTDRRGRSLTNLFARSTTALAPVSMSTPHLATTTTTATTATTRAPRSTTSTISEYYTPPLTQSQDPSPNLASPEAWQRQHGRASGPRPPWRPPNHTSPRNANQVPPQRITSSQESFGTKFPSNRRSTMGSVVRIDETLGRVDVSDLRGPNALGVMDIASEHGLGISSQPDSDETSTESVKPSERSPIKAEPKPRMVKLDPIAGRPMDAKPPTKTRSPRTIISKIRTALSSRRTASQSSVPTSSPLKRLTKSNTLSRLSRHRPATERSVSPRMARRLSDPFVVPLDEDSIPSRPSTSMGMASRHQRRKSWLSGGESWVKRLSMLVEGEEDEPRRPSSRASIGQSVSTKTRFEDRPRRTPSLLSRVLPSRTSSMGTHFGSSTFKRPGLPTSISTPALHLHRLSTVDLSLDLDLPEVSGLGLDDIINDSRRQGIIASLDLDQHFSFPLPPSSRPFGRSNSPMRSHSRGASEPMPPGLSNRSRVAWESDVLARSGSHKRNVSEPGQDPPMLEPTSTNSEKGSSVFPETPHLPSRQMESGYSQSRQPLQKAGDEPGIDPTRGLAGSTLTALDETSGVSSPSSTLFPTRSSAYSVESEPGDVVEAMISKLDVRGTAKADLLSVAEIKSLNQSSPWASTSNL
ncbi:hypothetical protein DB88DRAFT_480031 [Papiliotrema laurentii]|uniref:Uncharacterized protein n=1 Tax=Papiliotrema laurentii TaxID=5418 RepID=A0AAD9FXD6_PAPLA|nr:hypothetical protein DB88DRAFT_480031 [Papiliotrema laurentii]